MTRFDQLRSRWFLMLCFLTDAEAAVRAADDERIVDLIDEIDASPVAAEFWRAVDGL